MFFTFQWSRFKLPNLQTVNCKFKQQFNKRSVVRAFVLLAFSYTLVRSRTSSLHVISPRVQLIPGTPGQPFRVWDPLGYKTTSRGKTASWILHHSISTGCFWIGSQFFLLFPRKMMQLQVKLLHGSDKWWLRHSLQRFNHWYLGKFFWRYRHFTHCHNSLNKFPLENTEATK